MVALAALVPVVSPPLAVRAANSLAGSFTSLVSFQKPAPGLEDAFSGGREVIREAFRLRLVPSEAIPALIASLADATIKQYTHPLKSW